MLITTFVTIVINSCNQARFRAGRAVTELDMAYHSAPEDMGGQAKRRTGNFVMIFCWQIFIGHGGVLNAH